MSTPEQEARPQRRLRSLVVVFRHGARGPTTSGLQKLASAFNCSQDVATCRQHAVHEWQPSDLENTTSVGDEQMKILGSNAARMVERALPDVYAQICNGSLTPRWRSSCVERAVTSGAQFWTGFRATAGASAAVPSAPEPYPSAAHAESIFRPWQTHAGWRAACAALAVSETLQRAALKVRDRLERIERAVVYSGDEIECVSPGDEPDSALAETILDGEDGPRAVVNSRDADAVAGPDADDLHLAKLLYHTTYAYEALECERAWPSTALALRNSGSASSSSDCVSPLAFGCVAAPRCALIQRLTASDAAFLHHAAAWVWDQRFFGDAGARKHALAIGGAMLREVVSAMSDLHPFTVFSAHDFSILAALAAMRVKKHPPGALGFGAFLVFECWEEAMEPSGEVPTSEDAETTASAVAFDPERASVDVSICTEPFSHVAAGHPLLFAARMHNVVADVSLATLQHVVATVPDASATAAVQPGAAAIGRATHAHYGSMPMS